MPDPARFLWNARISRRRALAGAGLAGAGVAAACASYEAYTPPTPTGPFHHGVASGDPLPDRVVLWSRVSLADPKKSGAVDVRWMMAADRDFTRIVREGRVEAAPRRDWTVKVDVDGLEPGTEYFYRFALGDAMSPIGRTKTLPVGPTARFRIAAFSCSNFPFGYFNAYRHMAEGEPVDAALHLGDYFYEYGIDPSEYGAEMGAKLGRNHSPAHEVTTLDAYRARHAQYKSDEDLQAAHAAAPWITIWDDHESANNAYVVGAENHDPDTEGDWSARKQAAVRAYFEWMPIREPQPGRAREAIWRRFEIGDLATLIMLETRLTARSPEISWDQFPVPNDADPSDPDNQAKVAAFLSETVADPSRELLGAAQRAFVTETLEASVNAGQPWQLFGNQVILADVTSPDWTEVVGFWAGGLPGVVRRMVRSDPLAWGYFLRSRFGIPLNIDSWDGFPVERERLFGACRKAGANVVAFTGDTHAFWANELADQAGARVGVEFGVTGVTSPSAFRALRVPGVDAGRAVEEVNPGVVYNNPYRNGYVTADITPEAVTTSFWGVSTIRRRDPKAAIIQRFRVTPSAGGGASRVEMLKG